VIARTGARAHAIIADATYTYFDAFFDLGTPVRMRHAGGPPDPIGRSGATNALALDRAGGLFYSGQAPGIQGTFHGGPGGSFTQISDVGFYDLVFDRTYLYGLDHRTGVPYDDLFRMKTNGHGMVALARTGGRNAASDPYPPNPPGLLAVDDTFAYYVDQTGTSILRICKLAGL
jgi:hypothetical protein